MNNQMKKQTLSVVLATRNEAAFLNDCLESVKGLADEIIIFDENSTDDTRKIAHKHKAKVFLTRHEEIFHKTKNKAIRKSSCDWVLQLDTDERLTPELYLEIDNILKSKSFGFDNWLSPLRRAINRIAPIFKSPSKLNVPAQGYWIPRRNFFLKRYLYHSAQYPDPAIRLFQRGKGMLPAKDVHEFVKIDGSIGWLSFDMLHLSSPDFSRYLKRENYYSSLESQLMYKEGIVVSPWNTIDYLFLKPFSTFIKLYFRHRGFLDGFPGFVFCLYSGFHHAFSYMKLWEIYMQKHHES